MSQADIGNDTASSPEATIDDVLAAMACPITTRVPLVEPGTETPEVAEIYDQCRDLYGMVPKFIQLLAHAPGTAKSFLKFDEEIKVAALRAGERERSRMQVLAILKPSLDNSCHNCSHHNVNLARGLGYNDAQLAAIAAGTWRENDDFSEQEKVVLDWSDAVTYMSAARDQAAFDAMGEHFSHEEIVELTYTTALWNCTNRLAEALHLTAEPPGKGIDWGTD
jgi:uncharacterized peroxidase-related enzyme